MTVSDGLKARAADCKRAAEALSVPCPDLAAKERLKAITYRDAAKQAAIFESDYEEGIRKIAKWMSREIGLIERIDDIDKDSDEVSA